LVQDLAASAAADAVVQEKIRVAKTLAADSLCALYPLSGLSDLVTITAPDDWLCISLHNLPFFFTGLAALAHYGDDDDDDAVPNALAPALGLPVRDAATRPLITSLLTVHGPNDDHPLHLFPIAWDDDANDWVVTVDERVFYGTGMAAEIAANPTKAAWVTVSVVKHVVAWREATQQAECPNEGLVVAGVRGTSKTTARLTMWAFARFIT
jgi:hypothetical protein